MRELERGLIEKRTSALLELPEGAKIAGLLLLIAEFQLLIILVTATSSVHLNKIFECRPGFYFPPLEDVDASPVLWLKYRDLILKN